MFVYFIFSGTCKRTTTVSINLEKCVPCVGTYVQGSIDPALWYKVLALDSILVDCDQNLVWWSHEIYDEGKHRCEPEQAYDPDKVRCFFEVKEKLFRENVELSPTLAEMFETAEGIFHSLSPEVIDRDGNVGTYKQLLKLLHVYILPEIRFTQKHEKVVHDVLQSVEKEYENVEMLIKMNVQLKRNCEDLLSKQRGYLLSEDGISSILSSPSSDDDVIKLLLKHSEKDVRKLEDILSNLTDKITPLRNASDETSVKILADTRAKRDKVSNEKERISLAKEELINDILQRQAMPRRKPKRITIRRSQSVRNELISDRFERYKRQTTELENLSNDIKQQINIKIRMSSVREAIILTLKEIETDGSSFGYNRKKGSLEIEADLFDPAKKPEDWITLKEHVRTFLQTNQSDFGTKHEQFCTRVKENCKAVTEKAKRDFLINYCELEPGRFAFSVGSDPSYTKESMRFSTRWLFGCVPKEDCEALCKQISEHITAMADEIAIEIQGNNAILRTFHTQVYICYEEHVSEELMPVLSKLYEQSFRIQCKNLSTWIKDYSATELDSINRTMKNMFPDTEDKEIFNNQQQNSAPHVQRSTSLMGTLFGGFNETSSSWTWKSLLRRNRGAFSDPTTQTDQQKLNTKFTSAFENFFTTIRDEDTAVSIFSKLRHLTKAVQSTSKTFSNLCTENGKDGDICTDDMLDVLILLICRLDPESLLKLYAHLNLITDLSPYFLEGNINEYSLITLTGAYQHLFERQEMHISVSSLQKI